MKICNWRLQIPRTPFIKGAKKNTGSTFLVALFLSTLILSLGTGAAQMVIKELNFSSDLLFGEQSYYAAESGVEVALSNLSLNPVQNVSAQRVPLGFGEYQPLIDNEVAARETFDFVLPPLASQRWRLLADSAPDLVYSPGPADAFDISVTPANQDWQWKVLCQDTNGVTEGLQNTIKTGTYLDFLNSANGKKSDGTPAAFPSWRNSIDRSSCFFSVQSLSDENLEFTFTAKENITPPVAHVTSIGQAGNRQKRIEFDYQQNSLGGLFDFVFFHWEG